ncbi:ABC transporter permease [Paenibacillus cremeus]|uniref:Multidrug ABC transporter permease n=1 Tax=Paenibacillus cremeus TaxID=2163881 RepID=A0A559K838_9BACL|nr:ABC-2 family transporter protein [Paenibacillus cremeus]TVY08274.1 multidrug ABC transporter permease [Paenibacillus cremeus]
MIRRLRALWHQYAMLCRIEWAVLFAYRSESLIWMVGSFAQPLVSLSVWLSITGSGTLAGYNAKDYIVYFLGVLLVDRLTRSWDVWELENDIRQGTLSAKLMRPLHPVHWSIAQNVVYKTFFALLLIPSWAVLAWIWPVFRLETASIGMLMAAILSIFGAGALRFLIGYEFGLLAFWTNRASAMFALYEGIHLFLAGRIAPLSMFPEAIARLAEWLPFYVTVGFPVDLLTGKLAGHPELIRQGFAGQLIWIVILAAVFGWEWKQGLRKYSSAGG